VKKRLTRAFVAVEARSVAFLQDLLDELVQEGRGYRREAQTVDRDSLLREVGLERTKKVSRLVA
jgi:hypothetical protein